MTQEQLNELIAKVKSGVVLDKPDTRSAIDKAIPLPVGSKTITGIIGALVSYAAMKLNLVPGGDWSQVVDVITTVFVALGGGGLVAKYQRQINIAEETLKVMIALLDKVQESRGE